MTLALMFDRDGAPTDDPTEAWTVEIQEYDEDGEVVQRTYANVHAGTDPDEELPPTTPDSIYDPESFDFPKGVSWDIYYQGRQVTDLEHYLLAMGWGPPLPEREAALWVLEMRLLPSWRPAPPELTKEVDAWLLSLGLIKPNRDRIRRPRPGGGGRRAR
jgi:hypothetical protein